MAQRVKVQSKSTEPKPYSHKACNAPDVIIPANDAHQPKAALTLSSVGDNLTMSSLEIAEVTGKRHPDVLRDIRNMMEPLGMTYEQFCSKVPSQGGRPVTVANLPKRESLILVSGYSVELRAKIIDRWAELEAERTLPMVSLPADIQELIRRTDGISRMAIHKITEIEKVIPTLRAEFMTALVEADPRVAALNYRLPIDVIKEAGVPSKGRRGFSNTVRGRLLNYSIDHNFPIRRSPETDRQMFHVDAISGWMAQEGRALMRDQIDKVTGQGVLRLVRKSD